MELTKKRVLRAAERLLQLRNLKIERLNGSYIISSGRDSRTWIAKEAVVMSADTFDGIGFEKV